MNKGWLASAALASVGAFFAFSSPARELAAALALVAGYCAILDRLGLDAAPLDLDTPMWRFWVRRAFYQFLAPVLAAVGLSSVLWPDPLAKMNVLDRAGPLVRHQLAPRAAYELRTYLSEHPDDLLAHRTFLWAHFSGPLRESKDHVRDDASVLEYYRGWARAHPSCPQVAHLGEGIYWRSMGEPEKGLEELAAYPEPAPDDVRYERAQTLLALGRFHDAEPLLAELARKSKQWRDPVFLLAQTLEAQKRFDELDRVLGAMPERQLRFFDVWRREQLRQGNIAKYFSALGDQWLHAISEVHAILGLVLFGFWFFAIRWWDRFEPEPLIASIGAVAIGALMSGVMFFLYDAVQASRGVFLQSGPWYAPFGAYLVIAVFQETLKLVPAILVSRIGRVIDEPLDWAIYGALGALGFSVWGGLFLSGSFGAESALRALLLKVPLQVCLTGLVCLSFVRFRRLGRSAGTVLAVALPVAVVTHAAFLFLEGLSGRVDLVGMLAVFGAVGVLWAFRSVLGHTVARSPFRPRDDHQPVHSAMLAFWRGYLALLIGTYVVVCAEIGPSLATAHLLLHSVLNGLLVMSFVMLGALEVPDVPQRDEQIG